MAECGGRRLAELQQDTDFGALLAARPDQYEECREAEGLVHLRRRSVHCLRVRSDHGEQRSDRHHRIRYLLHRPGHLRRELAHALDYPGGLLPANRGAAYMDGMLFRGTQDGRVLAFDFKTGKQMWETTIADPKRGESVPSAPIAWDGLVFVGNAGGDYKGGKGRMYALDAKTGKIVWEFFLAPKVEGDAIRGPLGKSPLDLSTWKNAPGIPISGGGPGRRTRSIRRPGCCTSREAIRRPTSPPARARATISFPTRSSCSTPRRATSRTISRSCRRTGTTGTSPTRPS